MDEYIAWDYSSPGISFNVVSGRITIFKQTLVAMVLSGGLCVGG